MFSNKENEIFFVIFIPNPLLSILEAILTVSPNKQYLGIVKPTTPAKFESLFINRMTLNSILLNNMDIVYQQRRVLYEFQFLV